MSTVFIAATLSSTAGAGACPEEHVLSEPCSLENVSENGVQLVVREQVELDGWRDTPPLRMRMRHFTIEPSVQVPLRCHGDRPSLLYFISGEATEYSSPCAVPIVHKAGEPAIKFGADIVHWRANKGDVPAVLVSVDLIRSS